MSKAMNKFFPDVRDRAVRLVLDNESQHASRGHPDRHGREGESAGRGNRSFLVPAPNMLWVGDFTYVAFVLDALVQAVHARRPTKTIGLVHHSIRGSQYLSIKYTERLGEAGIEPSAVRCSTSCACASGSISCSATSQCSSSNSRSSVR